MIRALAILVPLLLPCVAAAQQAGDAFQIVRTTDSQEQRSNGSSSTHDSDALVERVIAVSDAGTELEYDLPGNASPDDRARDWKFPVRVFKPRAGPLQLRNRAELETRIDKWLKAAELPRSACGHWYFTWNAFRIECDPEQALQVVEAFAIGWDKPSEGALYADKEAQRSAPLKRKQNGRGFTAELAVNPEAIRKARVDNELMIAEINRQPLTREAARKAHAAEEISGTIRVDLDTDDAGQLRRRTRVIKVTIRSGGETVTRTVTDVIERRPIRPARNPDSI